MNSILLEHHGKVLLPLMEAWLKDQRFPPVLLITGPEGIGKRQIVQYLAQWLLCERAGWNSANSEQDGLFGASLIPQAPRLTPCGECANCLRSQNGNSIDFTEILPEASDEGRAGTLKIEQFRELKASQGFGSYAGSYKITHIAQAETLQVQAANSLLKILEEPPPGWIFILTAADITLLLPTLVSRCQRLRLKPMSPEQITQMLAQEKAPPERIALCAALAQGSWKKAKALSEEKNWEMRKRLYQFLESPARELNTLVDWAAQEPAHFQLLSDQLELFIVDFMRWSSASQQERNSLKWLNQDGQGLLQKIASQTASERWITRAEKLQTAKTRSHTPVNRKLLAQEVLMDWLQ